MTTQKILLDTGTNEVEMLELISGDQYFGVNILKLRQFLEFDPADVTPIHLSGIHPSILGTLQFRGAAITVVDLASYLIPEKVASTASPQIIMVCEFNNAVYGFRIEGLDRIHRIRWDAVQVPGVGQGASAVITGVFSVEGRDILILDFESIIEDIIGARGSMGSADAPAPTEDDPEVSRQRAGTMVMLVDDSHTVRRQISELLTAAGYTDLRICNNGEQALEEIHMLRATGTSDTSGGAPKVVVTDIEMPRMDGLTLCRHLKEEVPGLPVLILSSMISEQIALKCQQVAADGYLSKTESEKLISLLDEVCLP